ncbi:MAG: hypothetical protein KAT86_01590, partial [Candidatus Latescibacteria bacterium]|nr:hypothetical protein [Candidatus Latescibacterota bacterium]
MRWNKWKNDRAVTIKREIKDAIRKVRPDVKILSYSSAVSYRYGSGNMQDHNESYVDFTGIEFMPRAFFAAYPACLIDMKTNLSFARPLDHPTWIIPYIPGSPNSTAFAEAICTMGLHIPWYMIADTKILEETARFKYRLDAKNSNIHTRLAVLYSKQDWFGSFDSDFYFKNYFGSLDLLRRHNIQHEVISTLDLTPERLSRFSVLMLVSGKCLSAEQVEVIEDFVKNGGTVLLDGESSLYDKNGRRL